MGVEKKHAAEVVGIVFAEVRYLQLQQQQQQQHLPASRRMPPAPLCRRSTCGGGPEKQARRSCPSFYECRMAVCLVALLYVRVLCCYTITDPLLDTILQFDVRMGLMISSLQG